VPATATPAPSSAAIIYGDSLAAGWANWSWDTTTNFSYTKRYRTGRASLAVTYTAPWAGLYLHRDAALPTAGYSKLSLWVYGGTSGGQPIKLSTRDGTGKASPEVKLPAPRAGRWTLVEVRLSQLGSPANIAELFLQEAGGAARPIFFIDELRLVP